MSSSTADFRRIYTSWTLNFNILVKSVHFSGVVFFKWHEVRVKRMSTHDTRKERVSLVEILHNLYSTFSRVDDWDFESEGNNEQTVDALNKDCFQLTNWFETNRCGELLLLSYKPEGIMSKIDISTDQNENWFILVMVNPIYSMPWYLVIGALDTPHLSLRSKVYWIAIEFYNTFLPICLVCCRNWKS